MTASAVLTELTLAEARAGLAAKQFSARELAEAYIAGMAAARPLNAYITETPEIALDMAAASDERLATGTARPLDGIPVAVKDLFCTKGVLTTAGSKILAEFVPDEDATPFGRIAVDPILCIGCKKCISKGPDGCFLDGCPWDAIAMVDTAEVEKEVGAMAI